MYVCDMVNIDWGVDDEDDIYQVPDVSLQHSEDNPGIVQSRPASTFNPLTTTSLSYLALKKTKSVSPESYVFHKYDTNFVGL